MLWLARVLGAGMWVAGALTEENKVVVRLRVVDTQIEGKVVERRVMSPVQVREGTRSMIAT